MNYKVDPNRLNFEKETGIFIRASLEGGKVYAADIATLTSESLLKFLRSHGGHNIWAENTVLALLGHPIAPNEDHVKKYLIWSNVRGEFLSHNPEGHTNDIDQATRFSMTEASKILSQIESSQEQSFADRGKTIVELFLAPEHNSWRKNESNVKPEGNPNNSE